MIDYFADIKKCAQAVNMNLFELTSSRDAFKYLELDSIMKVLQEYLIHSSSDSVDTKVAVLKWIHHLFTQAENEVLISGFQTISFDVSRLKHLFPFFHVSTVHCTDVNTCP